MTRHQQLARVAGNGFSGVDELNIGAQQGAQVFAGERVMGAAEHQRVDLPGFQAESAYSQRVLATERYDFRGFLTLYRVRKTVARLNR